MNTQSSMEPRFTAKQGQYLSFIHHYTVIHGCAPAEADLQRYFLTSPPSVHQMVLTLEKRGLITRTRGQARSIVLRVAADALPPLGEAGAAATRASGAHTTTPSTLIEAVTRAACTVITKLFEQCDAYPIDDAEFLPLVGCVPAAVEQSLLEANLPRPAAAAARRRVEDFAVGVYIDLCARNDPDGADTEEDSETCRRLMTGRRGA